MIREDVRGPRTNHLGCRIARIAGWVDSSLRTFGKLSPSRMLVLYRGDRNTAESVLEIVQDRFGHPDYADLKLKFGCIATDRLSEGEAASLVHRFKNAVSGETDDATAEIHRLVAREAHEVLNSLDIVRGHSYSLEEPVREPSDAGQPAAEREGKENHSATTNQASEQRHTEAPLLNDSTRGKPLTDIDAAKIPPLDKDPAVWVKQVVASRKLINAINDRTKDTVAAQKKVDALKKARGRGKHDKGMTVGVDNDGHMWRYDPDDKATFWYYLPSLEKE